jgi:hypothetical protein
MEATTGWLMQINHPVSFGWRMRNASNLPRFISELSDASIESSLIDLLDAAEQYHCTSTLDAKHRAPDLNQGNRL